MHGAIFEDAYELAYSAWNIRCPISLPGRSVRHVLRYPVPEAFRGVSPQEHPEKAGFSIERVPVTSQGRPPEHPGKADSSRSRGYILAQQSEDTFTDTSSVLKGKSGENSDLVPELKNSSTRATLSQNLDRGGFSTEGSALIGQDLDEPKVESRRPRRRGVRRTPDLQRDA